MCFCSMEHSPAFSVQVHWHVYCMHACEIYAIDFSTVGTNLEKHILFVSPDLWRSDCTVMVGSVYIPVFCVLWYLLCPLPSLLLFGFCIHCCLCGVTFHLSHNSKLCKNTTIINLLNKPYLLHNVPDDC